MSHELSPKHDVLGPGVELIAAYCPDDERRVRHLIRAHGFPHFKRGNLIYSRKSWVDRYYSGETVDTSSRLEHPDANGSVITGATPSDRRVVHNALAMMKRVRRPKAEG